MQMTLNTGTLPKPQNCHTVNHKVSLTNKQKFKSQWKHKNLPYSNINSTLRTGLIPSYKVIIFTMKRQKNSCDNGPFLIIIINGSTMRETVVGKREQYLKLI